eukprot:1137056-Pelagomonas_calceolata.AAC.6
MGRGAGVCMGSVSVKCMKGVCCMPAVMMIEQRCTCDDATPCLYHLSIELLNAQYSVPARAQASLLEAFTPIVAFSKAKSITDGLLVSASAPHG